MAVAGVERKAVAAGAGRTAVTAGMGRTSTAASVGRTAMASAEGVEVGAICHCECFWGGGGAELGEEVDATRQIVLILGVGGMG